MSVFLISGIFTSYILAPVPDDPMEETPAQSSPALGKPGVRLSDLSALRPRVVQEPISEATPAEKTQGMVDLTVTGKGAG